MRILHLSDLHYGERYKTKIERMCPSLLKILKKINEQDKIELVVFSGDLVFSGRKKDCFEQVEKNIITPLLDQLSLKKDSFIICPGNHDMSDQSEIEAITQYINNISTNDNLDKFISNNDQQFELSFEKSNNYTSFIKEFYPNDKIDNLYHSFQRTIDGKKIGIISFHTAWRSFIGKHTGQLLIPIKIVFDALNSIPEQDIYISVMHHSLEDLKQFNRNELEDIIYEKFHINFSGHHHKQKQELMCCYDIGMLSVSAMATMSGDDGSYIGFSLIDIDTDTFDINIFNYTYSKRDNEFLPSKSTVQKLPMNHEKAEQVDILRRLKEEYGNVLEEADSLLIDYEETGEKTFIDYYNDPVLKEKSYYEVIEKTKNLKRINVETLINSNSIIYGKDKFGKTSLLRKVQLDILKNYISQKIVPIYIDFKHHKTLESINLVKEIKKIFRFSKKKAEKFISTSKLQILFDNFSYDNKLHVSIVEKLLKNTNMINILLASEETQECYSTDLKINDYEIKKLFLHPITRQNIRVQATKMLVDYDSDKKQEIIQKVISVFNQMNIPFNYWYLSLFLWIYKKEKNISINDNIEILILYIDKLLEREQIAKFNKNIDYDLFKKLLAEFAHKLLIDHYNDSYSMSLDELVKFITQFKENNIRFVTGITEIIDYLRDKGIIKHIKSEDRFTFRLSGVMEYFTAVYMTEDNDFLNQTLDDDQYFLSYANEIEIFSGLNRKNNKLLKKLYDKVSNITKSMNVKYLMSPDETLKDKLKHTKDIAETIANINLNEKMSVSNEDQDEIMDDIEPIQDFHEGVMKKKPTIIGDDYTTNQKEKFIFILARVFRSLTLVDDTKLMNDTFDLIMISYINIGFELLETIDNRLKSDSKKEIEKTIIDLLNNFIPLFTQIRISEAVLHKNLTRFIENKINKLEEDVENNQYQLMILYFMLSDIELKSNNEPVEKVTNNITMPSLRGIVVIKLLFYLLFKSNGNKQLESVLKEKIIKLQRKLYPKIGKNTLDNNMTKLLKTKNSD